MSALKDLRSLFKKVESTEKGKSIAFDKAVLKIINLVSGCRNKKNKVILIGNGGSASIASHISTDFLKNALIPSITFNDCSLITCLSNDFGYEDVFEKPIEILAQKNDILFSISSSGKSRNILDATIKAGQKGCYIVTLSGFCADNPLRIMGDINFYLPSNSYGVVEITHLAICHHIVDVLIQNRPNGQV